MSKITDINIFVLNNQNNVFLEPDVIKYKNDWGKNNISGNTVLNTENESPFRSFNSDIAAKRQKEKELLTPDNDYAPVRGNTLVSSNKVTGSVVTSTGLSADRVNSLLSGSYWTLQPSRILTYSFYEDSIFNGSYYGSETGVKEVSEAVKNNVRQVLAWMETVLNIDFQEVTETATSYGTLRYMLSSNPGYAYAYYPSGHVLGGDVHLKNTYQENTTSNGFERAPGNHGYMTLIHETGHALGLKHPHETPALVTEEDNTSNTVMSYRFTGNAAGTLMAYDLVALQQIYGSRDKEVGDTTYAFTNRIDQFNVNGFASVPTSFNTKQLIWDTGGNDTLNFLNLGSNTGGYRLDLNPGGWLTTNGAYRYRATISDPNVTNTNITSTYFDWGTSIAYGVTIENVINSSSSDTIFANSAPNTFFGYTAGRSVGADILWNTDSNDILDLSAYGISTVTQTQTGNDLILGLGANGSVTVKNYYAGLGTPAPSALNILYADSLGISTINLSLSPTSIVESSPAGLIYTLTRTGSTSAPLTVNFNLGGTAILGTDYNLTGANISGNGGSVTFAAGVSNLDVIVNPINDSVIEPDRSVIFTLAGSTGYVIDKGSATGTILDDDAFRSRTEIGIPISGPANSYPSSINVSGLSGSITKLTVTLFNLSHSWPDDVDVLLVGPSGLKSLLMSDVGGGVGVNGVTLTFDSTASNTLPDSSQLVSGTYQPTDFQTGDTFVTPAPSGTHSADLGLFNGSDPNGTWQLYVLDDANGYSGAIAGGWQIDFTTALLPKVTLEVLSPSLTTVAEDGSDNITYTFTRDGDLTNSLTVNYTVGGTATNGTDYAAIASSVTFAPGAATAIVTLDPTGDLTIESNETVSLSLVPSVNYAIGTQNPVTGTILNDDINPTISLSLSPAIVQEDGSNNLVYTFTRNGSTLGQFNVNFTLGGSALNGTDYNLSGATLSGNTGRVTFLSGSSIATVIVDPTPDTNGEADETVNIAISSNAAYNLGTTGQVIGTIADANDVRTGTTGNDSLSGGAGNDTLSGLAGNDTLNGGTGADRLIGGPGNDLYVVDNTGDVVVEDFNSGSDTVQTSVNFTGINIETITLTGSAGISATGDEYNNNLLGNSGANTLTGGSGNDTLNGGAGADTLTGGTGNDVYIVDNIGDLVSELFNEGNDTVKTSVNFTAGNGNSNIEIITLTGSSAISATGDDYNNAINGNSGANTLTGGGGNDTLNGGAGADTLTGGTGNDVYIVDNIGDLVRELFDEGNDTVQTSVNFTASNGNSNIEIITLTGSSAISATGDDYNNAINGNSGANTLTGGGGNDTLNGGAGADTLTGGTGNDVYIVDNIGDLVRELFDEGNDTVQTSVNFTASNGNSNIEIITLTGSSSISGTGDDSGNTINGNGGANTLTGNGGNDSLIGNAGNDSLTGGTGNDSLTGGTGNDSLTGGLGADSFIFTSPAGGVERINDFTLFDNDIISLSASGFNLPVGVLDPAAFRAGAGVTTANSASHRLIYNTSTGALFFDSDGNANGSRATQIATLVNLPALTEANFSIV